MFELNFSSVLGEAWTVYIPRGVREVQWRRPKARRQELRIPELDWSCKGGEGQDKIHRNQRDMADC